MTNGLNLDALENNACYEKERGSTITEIDTDDALALLAVARAVQEWGEAEREAAYGRDADLEKWARWHGSCLDKDDPNQCEKHRRAGLAYQTVEALSEELSEKQA